MDHGRIKSYLMSAPTCKARCVLSRIQVVSLKYEGSDAGCNIVSVEGCCSYILFVVYNAGIWVALQALGSIWMAWKLSGMALVAFAMALGHIGWPKRHLE